MTRLKKMAPIAAAAMLVSLTGQAQTLDTSGSYFRAGTGAAHKDVSRACYGLNGPGLKYRLGNECDIYGEFNVSGKFKKDGLEYSVNAMPSLYNGGTDTGSSRVTLAQMFVDGKGFDFAPDITFWAGKRYHRRDDVHIVDTQYIDISGVGGGASGIDLGPAKLAVAYFRTDNGDTAASKRPGSRVNFDLYDMAVNTDGTLRMIATFTDGDFTGGKTGTGITLQHKQKKFLLEGGENTLWLQYAEGSAGLTAATAGSMRAPAPRVCA